jgi:outer membrane receptor protein involved in Fe transport
VRPGELLAVSGFFKSFHDPIERAVVSSQNNEGQYQNVPSARVMGLEFEARTQLDHVSQTLRHFQIGGNLTLIDAEVTVPPTELGERRSLDPYAPDTRDLQGQSPYLINLDAGYINHNTGTSINLFYNLFGERMSELALGGSPHIYEQPRGIFDLGISQNLFRGLAIGFQAKNLFDASLKKTQEFKGQEYVVSEYKLGRTLKAGITYTL